MKKEYIKVFSFGKIAYQGERRSNKVTLDMTLTLDNKDRPVFSVSGEVWQANHRDILCGGQMLDDIWNDFAAQLQKPSTYKEILRLWHLYHLNDMHAGCIHQEAKGWGNESINKPCPKCGYRYGTAWTYRPIKKTDLKLIMSFLEITDWQERARIERGNHL